MCCGVSEDAGSQVISCPRPCTLWPTQTLGQVDNCCIRPNNRHGRVWGGYNNGVFGLQEDPAAAASAPAPQPQLQPHAPNTPPKGYGKGKDKKGGKGKKGSGKSKHREHHWPDRDRINTQSEGSFGCEPKVNNLVRTFATSQHNATVRVLNRKSNLN